MIIEFFIKYGYVIELLTATILIVYSLRKKQKIILRWIIIVIALFLVAFIWNNFLPATIIANITKYIIMFVIVAFGIMFCYRVNLWSAFFLETGAFTIQHGAFKIGYLIQAYVVRYTSEYFSFFVYITIDVLVYIAAFIFLSSKIKDDEGLPLKSKNKEIILIATSLIMFTTVFQNIFDFLIDKNDLILLLVVTCYDLMFCILIFSIQFGILKSRKLEQETQLMEHFFHMQKEQLINSKKNIDIINIKYHDFKYQISALGDKISKDELDSLTKTISVYDMYLQTGNEALDVVFAEKRIQCERENIKLTCMADGEILCFMQSSDVYSLFGNTIDNAIAATQVIKQQEKRIINISVKELAGMISIVIENHFIGNIKFEDDLPVTTKNDKMYHGFGMKSIKMIVEKYHGYMTIQTLNSKFILSILLQVNDTFQ